MTEEEIKKYVAHLVLNQYQHGTHQLGDFFNFAIACSTKIIESTLVLILQEAENADNLEDFVVKLNRSVSMIMESSRGRSNDLRNEEQ